ncbi:MULTISPECIES: phytanoyl-CoA dioxygenase family protein [unclassified Mucilaginibacter]|uniref:phytanoyl-CoA dioxygenase family protein n=1 Tax=unclassified Mucilaginibacter TaxID=2617802 RepID=UPI002AC90598|nr:MULTISPECIES: phytanoyl-CoA dioxygenase family protein [unclassified Mucilaginibacter]MEB0261568.1 phytanoyl-CoA dioxygenase family protein [Mucilaginibacter sp. 10I4]MEB0277180.1 phytanoyl-CoA dioxygenase family protein [Mucilaginibacter sp. 10B2]MEB0300828.1 phytanoyl-CoA dioxygenase family protein [Mucilaginibacter sp. 5C4]WPX25277.1 phytanoyl-CoA dioxygenase family protein [Mucilaginibacter sp. 5C4]
MEKYRQYAEQFWKQGYLILENFFSHDIMDDANEKILKHYGMNPTWQHTDEFITKSAVEVIPWFPYREGITDLDTIDQNEVMNAITDAIVKDGWKNLYCMAMFSKQGSIGQAWHQDSPPESKSDYNLNRLVYTHDIAHETGGEIVIYPQTHKAGAIPTGIPDADIDGQIVYAPKKGTLIFLHGHCWHRVMPIKGAYRVSTNFRAIPLGTPDDITDICVYRNMRYKFSTNEVVETR